MMDCKHALEEADGDVEKAFTILREKGIARAVKRAGRSTGQGVVEAYLHRTTPDFPPQVGVLIEVDCETDFVAKGEDFRKLAKELALQVAAATPRWLNRDDIPDQLLVEERNLYERKAEQDGKPPQAIPKIVDGQVEKFIQENVLLKLSGEALGGARDYGIDLEVVQTIAAQVKRVHEMGVQIALVVGGGNIFRGLAASDRGFDRATGDYMGMLATVINALALQDALERTGIPARTMTAIQMPQVAEPYIRRRAVRHLE